MIIIICGKVWDDRVVDGMLQTLNKAANSHLMEKSKFYV